MALADASVLIPLARAGGLWLLKKLYKKIRVTELVAGELVAGRKTGSAELEEAMNSWIRVEARWNNEKAAGLAELEGISRSDASLLLAAKESGEEIITNDYRVHRVAKAMNVKTLWLATIILICAKKKVIGKKEAKGLLLDLVGSGMWMNAAVYAALERKIGEAWAGRKKTGPSRQSRT